MKRLLLATATSLLLLAATTMPAHAATPTGNDREGTQYGSMVRSVLAEHWDGSGSTFMTYGSGGCTSRYDNYDSSVSARLNNKNWRNAASRVADFSKCDHLLHKGTNFTGASRGWEDFGTGGKQLTSASGWNDEVESFRLS